MLHREGTKVPSLFACGELADGVFFAEYPGGSRQALRAVFDRRAG
ncbi:hypothetical protein [Tateyamaria sp.]